MASGLDLLFESQGFGTPRDAGPRVARLLASGAILVVSVVCPFVVWRVLLPKSAPAVWVIVAIGAVATVLVVLGVKAGG